jgi:1-acyl-sn-glycerol-3-phosphate acyltransferase
MTQHPHLSGAYRAVMTATAPIVAAWGRLEVTGLEAIPLAGPTLIVCNHDSNWDPIAIGMAARPRRQIRALAKASLWKNPLVARVLDGMGQIPLQRGQGDAAALDAAIAELRAGACIGIFPEGTISRGAQLRAHNGAGRLREAVPDTVIVCATVQGTVDIQRLPKRPRIAVHFYLPKEPVPLAGEGCTEFVARLMAEIRQSAPVAVPGRRKAADRFLRAAASVETAGPTSPSEVGANAAAISARQQHRETEADLPQAGPSDLSTPSDHLDASS